MKQWLNIWIMNAIKLLEHVSKIVARIYLEVKLIHIWKYALWISICFLKSNHWTKNKIKNKKRLKIIKKTNS